MSESKEQSQRSAHGDIDESLMPKLGMVFDNDEKAYQFYCLYGREMGFGVRKHLVKRRASGLVYSRVFSCYKEGFCRTSKPGKKPRLDARTGCRTHTTVRVMTDGRYRISEFEPNHNHELICRIPDVFMYLSDSSKVAQRFVKNKCVGGHAVGRPAHKSCVQARSVMKLGSVMRHVPQSAQGRQVGKSASESVGNASTRSWVPRIDMEFEDDEQAYQFYINYATRIGFSVRKHLAKQRASGVIYSQMYCCHKEGHTRRNKEQQQGGRPKPYDRTGCLASMTIKITKNGSYRITEFQSTHNHPLVIQTKTQLFEGQWQRGLVKTQEGLMDLEDDLEKKAELPSKEQIDGDAVSQQLLFASSVYKNYLPSKRSCAMKVGDVGAVMQYMQGKQVDDPSFYYALQLDRDDRLTNIFWCDAKSVVDFEYFGDVLCFDTTYKMSDYGRPFALFVGVNHHKQIIIFGAAFLYDETEESFKWLFETFQTVMSGKQPKVVLTDWSVAMSNAIAAVWPHTTHRLCVWHMHHNAVKHLNSVFQGSTTFAKDFSRCLYDCEEEDEFLLEWKTMLEKYDLGNNEWLANLYENREKWALAYDRETFCADIKNTLLREGINSMLIEYLNLDLDLLDFFKHYEKEVEERRYVELQADIHANQRNLKLPASRMLRQAANAYTPAVFNVFQREFELSVDCMVYICGQVGTLCELKVKCEENPKEYIVKYDSSDSTIFCSCQKFEFMGIQCRHVLKALDIVNIKELPPTYILKRWTKDIKGRSLEGENELAFENGSMSSIAKRYNSLCCLFNKIAERAAETMETYSFIESLSDQLMDQIYHILQTKPPGNLKEQVKATAFHHIPCGASFNQCKIGYILTYFLTIRWTNSYLGHHWRKHGPGT